jgi:isoquinoline 1-oxidoreductase beta subunit
MTLQAGLHIDHGAVREGSFSDYHYARMRNTPAHIEVHNLSDGSSEPGGAGELGFPAAAAAVANAWVRATGRYPARFPIAG